MLTLFDRIQQYKSQNYFQFNSPFVDIYAPKLEEWVQSVDKVTDLLEFASSLKLDTTNQQILTIRIIGGEASEEVERVFDTNLNAANYILAGKLGCSSLWAELKPDQPPRHFLTIVVRNGKPVPHDKPRKRGRPTPISRLSGDIGSV